MELRKTKDEKVKEKGEKGKEEKDEKKKPGFVAKAVLAAGLMLAVVAGCEDRTTINNYNCPDSGTQDAAAEVEQDAVDEEMESDIPEEVADAVEDVEMEADVPEEVTDAVDDEIVEIVEEDINEEEVECVADLTPVTCDSSEPVAEGVMTLYEPLVAGNISFELYDTEEHGGIASAIIDVVDECDNVLTRDKAFEGSTKEMTVEGATYMVTVDTVHLSDDNPWADASVTISCDNMCEVASGVIRQGESLVFDLYRLHLEDLDVTIPGEPAASVNIENLDATVVYDMLRIPKGEHRYFDVYRIRADEITAGYTFGSKWAQFTISTRCED